MGGFSNQNWNALVNQRIGVDGFASLLGFIGGLGATSGIQEETPDEDGWFNYIGCRCPRLSLCQFKQHKDGIPWVGYAYEFRPEFNVAYLKWRLTGIAKESGFNDWSW